MKIAVVTDSGSGLTKKEAEALGMRYLPLQIVDEDKTYLDGVDIDVKQIFAMIKEGKMLKTSLPPLGLVEEEFKQLKKEGYDHILCVSITSGLSSTMQSIMIAAETIGINISCVECYSTGYIQQYIAKAAKRLVDENVALEDILERLSASIKHSDTLIIPDDLDHLKRGGRLTPLAAALGGMLKIKPVLQLNETSLGKIDTFSKVRTMSKAMANAVDTFVAKNEIDENYEIAVLHSDALETAKQLEGLYFTQFPEANHIFGFIGPVISVHTGIGCIGLQYVKKV